MVAPRGNRDFSGDVTGDGFQMPVLIKILFLCLKKKDELRRNVESARDAPHSEKVSKFYEF
jgi:hypothetical protein